MSFTVKSFVAWGIILLLISSFLRNWNFATISKNSNSDLRFSQQKEEEAATTSLRSLMCWIKGATDQLSIGDAFNSTNNGTNPIGNLEYHGLKREGRSESDNFQPSDESRFIHSKVELKELFMNLVNKEIHFNNWDLGCNDLQFLAPYIKAITNRYGWRSTGSFFKNRQIIFDIGANNGDDARSILGVFQPVLGMCAPYYSSSTLLFSVEPSPKVFCELKAAVAEINPPLKNIHMLNIALSSQIGNLIFSDPGDEGGKIIGSTNHSKMKNLVVEDWNRVSTCQLETTYKKQSINKSRSTVVPTYTLDFLMTSLEVIGKVRAEEKIFMLKIDTEGHDQFVLLGAKQLLYQKRIEFVIFETYKNTWVKNIVQHMAAMGYECYFILPDVLVPVHAEDWWYQSLDNYTGTWWGNGICGIRGGESMAMLWRMYHSDNIKLANSYVVLYS